MKKQLRNWMLAAAAFLAVGASAQTLETVWSQTTGALGSTGETRFAAAIGGKIIANDKKNGNIIYWDGTEANQGATLHALTDKGIGVGINVDDAGNIIVNTAFPNAASSTNFVIVPADGSAPVDLLVTLPSGEGARFDQIGRVLGNVLSEEGGYMFIAKNGVGVVDVVKIVNGEQNADYSQAVTTVAFTNNTSTVILPTPGLTVADIDAMMDNDGDISKSFIARQRGNSNCVFYWDAEADVANGMSKLNLTSNVEGATTAGASNEGFDAFQLQGKTYYVCPITATGATAERGTMFGVFDETGVLVANVPAAENLTGSATVGSIAVEANDENSVFIYRFLPAVAAAKYKFSVTGAAPEPVKPLYIANDLTGWNYDEPAEFTYDEATGKYTYVLGTAEAGLQEFSISTVKGADTWNTGSLIIANNEVIAENNKEYTLATGIGAIMTDWASQWTITVDLKANTISAVAATEKPVKPLAVDYANPASQSTVESLYEVILGFQEEISINTEITAPAMVMTNTGQAIDENCTLTLSKSSAFEAVVSLSKEITEAGIYKVVVMAGTIKGNTTGGVNEEIVLAYEVKPASQAVFTFDPADGSTVESLNTIYLDYADGLMVSWSGTAELKDAAGTVVAKVANPDVVIPEDKANDFSYIPVRAILPLDTEITAAGTYTLTVPAGYFLTGSNYSNSPELTATYTIEEKTAPLYAVGAWQGWDPANATEFAFDAATGKYTLTMGTAEAPVSEFKMSTAKGDWDAEGGFNSGVICVADDQKIAENGKEYPLYVGGNANITFDWASAWTVTVDLKANTISAVAATEKPGQEQPEGPTLTAVWAYTTGALGDAGHGRFGTALGGKLIVPQKNENKLLFWDENNQGAEFKALGEGANLTDSIGVGINVDDAGNIVLNTQFPNAGSSTDFIILPADGSEKVKLQLTLPSGEGARFDQIGHILGNVLSEEGGYMFIAKNGVGVVDVVKIVNGEQNADYSQAVTTVAFTNNTSTVILPTPGLTVADIDAMMDNDGDISKSFIARQRGNSNCVFYWDAEADVANGMSKLNLTSNVEGATTAGASNEGFAAFKLQGKTYYVCPITATGATAERGTMFGVFDETGVLVANITAAENIPGSATVGSISIEANDENSVFIYRYLPTKFAGKYKFSVPAQGSEEPKALYITGAGFTPEWAPAEAAEFTYDAENDVYTYNLEDANSEFKISTAKGTWDEFNAGALQVVGNADLKVGEVYNLEKGTQNIKVYDFGAYILKVSLTNNTIMIENASGIEGIEGADNNAPVRFFNLQGVEVANPENGIFIRVQGNKATKVLVK